MDDKKMAVTSRGLLLLLAGFVVMVLGFVLLSGGGVEDPQVFNYDMFDTRRLVLAPVTILAGIVIIAVSILGEFKDKPKNK